MSGMLSSKRGAGFSAWRRNSLSIAATRLIKHYVVEYPVQLNKLSQQSSV